MKKYFVLILIISSLLFSCKPKHACKYDHINGYTQGTTYSMTYENCTDNDYHGAIDSILRDFDMSLSQYVPNSIISRINSNDTTVRIDEHFRTVFLKSKEIWEQSGGLMDITVGPIINAIGFGAKKQTDIDSSKIKDLLRLVGLEKVKLVGNRILKADTAMKLDVNSIAQGYSVDVVSEFLEKKGVVNYMVEIGGEVRARGKNPKQELWRIGIDQPKELSSDQDEALQVILGLKDKCISTAGNYRKFHVENGVKYTHIINPKTGLSAKSRLLSVSVVATDCITSDGWDTALMVMGLEKSIEFLKHHPELEAYLIYNDEKGNYQVYMTNGLKSMITK
ncbi:MAG: FAD:protein FMN transferase [Bacteroidota bacterium]